MWCRIALMACVLFASWLGSATVACGQDLPPVEFTGPLSNPRPEESNGIVIVLGKGTVYRSRLAIDETENWRCYGYSELSGICLVGLANDVYLGSIPLFGPVGAFADVEASALGAGPGVGVRWYIWEGITTSFRWDFLRGVTVTTSITP
jgi:hypothetical protein